MLICENIYKIYLKNKNQLNKFHNTNYKKIYFLYNNYILLKQVF